MRAEVLTPRMLSSVKTTAKKIFQPHAGTPGAKCVRLLSAPDRADQRIEHVVHHHAPARHIPKPRMNFSRDVRERRTRARIRACHTPVADPGEQHRDHRDQNRRDHMSAPAIAEDTEDRHWRDGLNDDHAVKDQVPQRERAPQARSAAGCRDWSFVAQITPRGQAISKCIDTRSPCAKPPIIESFE